MEVPITQFRREIFELVSRAMRGESISVVYKGERFRIVPEKSATTRFDRVTPLALTNPSSRFGSHEAAKEHMQAEMEKEWEEDWKEI